VNRRERRRHAAMARQDKIFDQYVRHLPEVGPEVLGRPGVHHVVFHHDGDCRIYDGAACSCEPEVRFFAEPVRV
jgi:hypothetical protein